jgi:hypothetical protein
MNGLERVTRSPWLSLRAVGRAWAAGDPEAAREVRGGRVRTRVSRTGEAGSSIGAVLLGLRRGVHATVYACAAGAACDPRAR